MATTTDRYPAAYVRKSQKLAESASAQLEAIKAIAARDGVNGELLAYSDVGVSGGFGKRGERSAWARLQADIAAGSVSAVYISGIDRAGRSIEEWLGFARRCRDLGVRIVDQTGEDRASEDGEDTALFEAWAAQKEHRKAKERSARAKATREARGDLRADRSGRLTLPGSAAPYGWQQARAGEVGLIGSDFPDPRRVVLVPNPQEPLEPILQAVKETKGNIARAAKLLNERGVPSRSGRPWSPRTVDRIIDREAPRLRVRRVRIERAGEMVTVRVPAGRHPLSRLVRCHCGTVMTPNANRKEVVCSTGHKVGTAVHADGWPASDTSSTSYDRKPRNCAGELDPAPTLPTSRPPADRSSKVSVGGWGWRWQTTRSTSRTTATGWTGSRQSSPTWRKRRTSGGSSSNCTPAGGW